MNKVDKFVKLVGQSAVDSQMALASNYTKGFTKGEQKQVAVALRKIGVNITVAGKDALLTVQMPWFNPSNEDSVRAVMLSRVVKVFFPIVKSGIIAHAAAALMCGEAMCGDRPMKSLFADAEAMTEHDIEQAARKLSRRLA